MRIKPGEVYIFNDAEQEVSDTYGNKIILKGYHELRKVVNYRLFGRIKEWFKDESWYILDNDITKVVNCCGYVEQRCLRRKHLQEVENDS